MSEQKKKETADTAKVESPKLPNVAYPLKARGNVTNLSQQYFNRLAGDESARYLFNNSGLWHQGIHLRASKFPNSEFENDKICAIADGKLIAYKVDSEYKKDAEPPLKSAVYSTGYFLLKHEMSYPKDNVLTFYSLYRHTAKLSEYKATAEKIIGNTKSADKHPVTIRDDKKRIIVQLADNLTVCVLKHHNNKTKFDELLWYRDEKGVEYSPKEGEHWSIFHGSYEIMMSEPMQGIALLTANNITTQVDTEVKLDKPIDVKAGEELGLMGEYNQIGESGEKLLHLEVFTYDNIEQFKVKAETAYRQDKEKKGIKDNFLYVARESQLYTILNGEAVELEKTKVEIMVPLSDVAKQTVKGKQNSQKTKDYYNVQPYLYQQIRGSKEGGIYVDDSHVTHGLLFPGVNVFNQAGNGLCIFKHALHQNIDPKSDLTIEQKNELDPMFKSIMEELDLDKDKNPPVSFEAGKLKDLLLNPIQQRRLTGIVAKHESEWKKTKVADFSRTCGVYRDNGKEESASKIEKRVEDLSIKLEVDGFNTDKQAYYIHPLGMIGLLAASLQGCIPFKQAREIALQVSGGFEGKTPRYDTLADNFDGAGMSWGIIQFNFGQDTLGPLLRKMRAKNLTAFNSAFSNHKDLESLNAALDSGKIAQINWAKNMQLPANRSRWREIFNNLAKIDEFNDIQLEAVKPYDDQAVRIIKWMRGLYPDLMKQVELKTFVALHDLAIQQGSIDKARNNILAKCNSNPPKTQDEFIRVIVTERGAVAGTEWRADSISRRLGILNKKATTVTHSGKTSTRTNINFKLIEDKFICDL